AWPAELPKRKIGRLESLDEATRRKKGPYDNVPCRQRTCDDSGADSTRGGAYDRSRCNRSTPAEIPSSKIHVGVPSRVEDCPVRRPDHAGARLVPASAACSYSICILARTSQHWVNSPARICGVCCIYPARIPDEYATRNLKPFGKAIRRRGTSHRCCTSTKSAHQFLSNFQRMDTNRRRCICNGGAVFRLN